MPRKLSGPNWGRALRVAGAAGAVGAIAVGAATAEARYVKPVSDEIGAACVVRESKQAFIDFGDAAAYFLMPGGDFEGTLDWASSGPASIVAEDKPFELNAADDSQALRLGRGSSVTSPPMCVTADIPHLRFVARAAGSGRLAYRVRLYRADGEVVSVARGSVPASAYQGWAPSGEVDLGTKVLTGDDVPAYVDIRFTSHGDWQLDDIFVDPFAR